MKRVIRCTQEGWRKARPLVGQQNIVYDYRWGVPPTDVLSEEGLSLYAECNGKALDERHDGAFVEYAIVPRRTLNNSTGPHTPVLTPKDEEEEDVVAVAADGATSRSTPVATRRSPRPLVSPDVKISGIIVKEVRPDEDMETLTRCTTYVVLLTPTWCLTASGSLYLLGACRPLDEITKRSLGSPLVTSRRRRRPTEAPGPQTVPLFVNMANMKITLDDDEESSEAMAD